MDGWYSRLDLDICRSPLLDKLLTALHDPCIPCLLVSQPCPERTTLSETESIAIECGWRRRKSSEEEKGADDEDGRERSEGRAGHRGTVVVEERREKRVIVREINVGETGCEIAPFWLPMPNECPCYKDRLAHGDSGAKSMDGKLCQPLDFIVSNTVLYCVARVIDRSDCSPSKLLRKTDNRDQSRKPYVSTHIPNTKLVRIRPRRTATVAPAAVPRIPRRCIHMMPSRLESPSGRASLAGS